MRYFVYHGDMKAWPVSGGRKTWAAAAQPLLLCGGRNRCKSLDHNQGRLMSCGFVYV